MSQLPELSLSGVWDTNSTEMTGDSISAGQRLAAISLSKAL